MPFLRFWVMSKAYLMQRSTPKRVFTDSWSRPHTGNLCAGSARACVCPFGILAHYHKIYLFRLFILKRAVDIRVELYRPQVYVLVELETEPEQKPSPGYRA